MHHGENQDFVSVYAVDQRERKAIEHDPSDIFLGRIGSATLRELKDPTCGRSHFQPRMPSPARVFLHGRNVPPREAPPERPDEI